LEAIRASIQQVAGLIGAGWVGDRNVLVKKGRKRKNRRERSTGSCRIKREKIPISKKENSKYNSSETSWRPSGIHKGSQAGHWFGNEQFSQSQGHQFLARRVHRTLYKQGCSFLLGYQKRANSGLKQIKAYCRQAVPFEGRFFLRATFSTLY
jgi:hypothetical protein